MLTKEEKTIMERVQDRSDKWIKWLPLKWSVNLVNEMKKKKLIGTHLLDTRTGRHSTFYIHLYSVDIKTKVPPDGGPLL